jgi:hypothetical protein
MLLEKLKLTLKINNQELFFQIFQILELYIFIYKKKIGANIYQIPLYIKKEFRLKKGLSNFLKVLENKKDTLYNKIYREFLDILSFKGSTLTSRDNVYNTAIEEKSNLRFLKPRKKKVQNINKNRNKNINKNISKNINKFNEILRYNFKKFFKKKIDIG